MISSGLDHAALAKKADISLKTVYRWLHLSEPPNIPPVRWLALADALQVSGRYLIDGHESPALRVRLTPDESLLIEMYRRLAPPVQHQVMDHVLRRIKAKSP